MKNGSSVGWVTHPSIRPTSYQLVFFAYGKLKGELAAEVMVAKNADS